jgi:hypothetical protein
MATNRQGHAGVETWSRIPGIKQFEATDGGFRARMRVPKSLRVVLLLALGVVVAVVAGLVDLVVLDAPWSVIGFVLLVATVVWAVPKAFRMLEIEVTRDQVRIDQLSCQRADFGSFAVVREWVMENDEGPDTPMGEVGFFHAGQKHVITFMGLERATRCVAGLNHWLQASAPARSVPAQ